jgi:hypothetical protein
MKSGANVYDPWFGALLASFERVGRCPERHLESATEMREVAEAKAQRRLCHRFDITFRKRPVACGEALPPKPPHGCGAFGGKDAIKRPGCQIGTIGDRFDIELRIGEIGQQIGFELT